MKNSISQLLNYSISVNETNAVLGGVLTDNGSGSYAGVANGTGG